MVLDADPFAALSRRQRWSLHRRMRRAWRQGLADRDLLVVLALKRRAGIVALRQVRSDQVGHLKITELAFDDGCRVRLGFCHPGTVAHLAGRVSLGPVLLERVARHGSLWGLYFRTSTGLLAMLAGEARLPGGGGGALLPRAAQPAPPSPLVTVGT